MKIVKSEDGAAMEALAQEIEHQAAADAPVDPQQEQETEQQAQAMRSLDAGMVRLTLGLFQVLRAVLSKNLPELREEWTDAVLQAPATALVPLLKKYLASLMARLAEQPELAVFAMTMIPLVMGYLEALSRHENTVTDIAGPGPAAANDGQVGGS